MKIYLAGVLTAGNLKSFWKENMKIYLAGTYSRPFVISEQRPYILESFYYIKNENEGILKMRPLFKDFLLDSGAFTFMNNKGLKCDWDLYVEQYAQFINKNSIELFFELDIDSVVGLKEVERLRFKLEILTNKKCIPCWHKNRGLEYWRTMSEEYNYIALGTTSKGLKVDGTTREKLMAIMPTLLQIAKKNNCKVHGLGFTNMEGMEKYKFHSVDSTAWLYGNRGGFLYQFNGKRLDKIHSKEMRLKGRAAAIHNFNEWVKFSKYAENNL